MSGGWKHPRASVGRAHGPRTARGNDGFILIAVLVVIMLSSMVVVSLLFRMRAEETATAGGAGSEQAWESAMSGVYAAMRVVARTSAGSADWEDNPAAFRQRLVVDDGGERWYFSVFSAGETDREEARFGLTDEASKLNINTATEEMLGKLPKLTPYLVQGLLDFLDDDDTPRPEGAEQEYYDALPTPYGAFNKALTTVDELLLVRGFTPALLYGEDANWNFQLDPNEDDGELQFPPDNKDGKLDTGLRSDLTVASYDLDQGNDGVARVDINGGIEAAKEAGKTDSLPEPFFAYLQALHKTNVRLAHPADVLEAKGTFKDEAGKEIELESGIGKAELAAVLDRFTTRSERRIPGLINVNTASARVLQTLPGIDEALADAIVAARRNLRAEQRRTPAWLFQEAIVDAEQFKKLMPFLTARSLQFSFHVVGYGIPSGRYRVLEAVIDTADGTPSVLYVRDITRLGLPFKIETEGQDGPGADPSQLASHHG